MWKSESKSRFDRKKRSHAVYLLSSLLIGLGRWGNLSLYIIRYI